jgi:hypothetical protein
MFNGEINELLKELTFEQNIVFGFSCINRLRDLPQVFINSDNEGIDYLNEIIPKESIETVLNDMANNISQQLLNDNTVEIDENIELLEKLLIDDEIYNSTEKNIFFYYVIIIIHLFEYIKVKDCKSIYRCSNAMLEILNQTKHDEYCKINKNGNDKEMEEYVDMEIDNEIKKQIEIIKLLNENDKNNLNKFIENNKIKYNG